MNDDVMLDPALIPTPVKGILGLLAKQSSFSIVQIGAYIGNTVNDPLYDFLRTLDPQAVAKIVLVEPIHEYFDRLCETYSHVPSIEFENVAISETTGEAEMYRLDVDPVEHGFPEWLAQLSSLREERMGKLWDASEANNDFAAKCKQFYSEHQVVEKVTCMTLHELLAKHQIEDLDLLLIDAEGYDYKILKTLDFSKLRPQFINYERVLLQEDEQACREMIAAQGYLLVDWGHDTFCVIKERVVDSIGV